MTSKFDEDDERVLLVAPTRRDAEVTQSLLTKAHVTCVICDRLDALIVHLPDQVGAIMLTDHALSDPALERVFDALDRQPPWSDVPVVLLTQMHPASSAATKLLSRFHNVTVLDRPTSTRSMISAVQAALRARRRQYELRRQMQAQAAAEHALREADRRKDEFLATLAHELRNPLAPLRTGLHLLDTRNIDRDKADRVRMMMGRQLSQLVKLIDDLLDVSRISTGKVILRMERIDMRNVVHAALESCQTNIQSSDHALTVHVPPDPVWVDGDASRLEQVICNLMNNACKYTPRGGRIEVTLAQADGRATLEVTDNGMGIPEDMLPLVFDMFTQVDRNLDRAQGGLGIGLSLVRRLMRLHGGEVHGTSKGPREGSTFTIEMPTAAALQSQAETSTKSDLRNSQPSIRILVVDDNRDAADSLSLLLSAQGHQIRTVYGGADALDAVEEFRPQAIFCDLGMPAMSGFEVARRLLDEAVDEEPPVLVALTGWGTDEDKRRTREGGFDFHVTKPIAIEELDRILAQLGKA